MEIRYSKTALQDLDEIWEWTASNFGVSQADDYLHFVQQTIGSLAESPDLSRKVIGHDTFRYLLIQWRPRSNGHVVLFTISGETIEIAHIFHTSQDWAGQLKNG